MPAIESRLPKRAVRGELMYFKPRMNKIPVIKYATLYHVAYCVTVSIYSSFFTTAARGRNIASIRSVTV